MITSKVPSAFSSCCPGVIDDQFQPRVLESRRVDLQVLLAEAAHHLRRCQIGHLAYLTCPPCLEDSVAAGTHWK